METTATVSMDPACVRKASVVKTAARPIVSTTAWAGDVVSRMSVFATSRGQALTAPNSSVQTIAMITDAVSMAPVNAKRASPEKTVVSSRVRTTATTVACV